MVENQKPYASEIKKLEKKNLVTYVYVGKPKESLRATLGAEPRIQLNDSFARLAEIKPFIIEERTEINEAERALMVVSIKADQNVKMGLISDVKQELRKAEALKLNYSTKKGDITKNE